MRHSGVLWVVLVMLTVSSAAHATPGYHMQATTGAVFEAGDTLHNAGESASFGSGITVPFPVRLFDDTRESLFVRSNGQLLWGASFTSGFDRGCLPGAGTNDEVLLPYWSDSADLQYVGDDYGIFKKTAGTEPNRRFIVEWRAHRSVTVPMLGTLKIPHTFAVVLREDTPVISMLYTGVTTTGGDATIGVHSPSSFLEWSCNGSAGNVSGTKIDVIPDPMNTSPPALTGTVPPREGDELDVSVGTWSSIGSISYERQIRRCTSDSPFDCTDVGGATGTSYTPTADDVGMRLRVRVTATTPLGSDSAVSAPTEPVDAAPPAPGGDGGDGGGGGGGASAAVSPLAGTGASQGGGLGGVARTEAAPLSLAALRVSGGTISFRLSAPGRVGLTLQRGVAGRRLRGRCVRPARRLRRARRCTRWVRARRLTHAGVAGVNSLRLGRLPAGRYRVVAALPGAPAVIAAFTVARRR
jgi:hypothetical protein